MDIGQPWDLLEANTRALQSLTRINAANLEEGVTLIGPIKVEKGTRIRTGTYIEGPVYIGPDCDIGPNCYIRPYTSIGKKVRIGNACEIKNSIIMEETHIAHLSYVGDSVIGAKSNLGAGTITANIRFDKKNVSMNIKKAHLDSGRRKLGIIMGDNSQTGIMVGILPGRKIGSQVWIAPGLIVSNDVPSESFLKKEGCFPRKDL
jgi:bifunctional UDP-N-acetylglucosamine pyrophosphorylase/glucosamine-1-phosphate N-acetyltransferase